MSSALFAALASRVARGISRLERDEICCGDLTLQQFETLRTLHASGPLTLGAAARSLGIDLSTASRNLGLLVKRGYLKRTRGKDDARHVSFSLSKKGAGCLDSLCCDERMVFAAVFARVPPEHHMGVIKALEVLATALAEQPAAEAVAPCCAPGKTCG